MNRLVDLMFQKSLIYDNAKINYGIFVTVIELAMAMKKEQISRMYGELW